MQMHSVERPEASERARRCEPTGRNWYRIVAKEDAGQEAVAEVYIYDEIGFFGITAADFVRDLTALQAKQINLHLNTPGGDVFDGIAIHNALRQHPATVAVQVDSLAASIGSVIAMAGDSVTMAQHATLMIHDPFGFVVGDAADMRKMGDVLDQLGDTIAGVYAARAGGSVREWRDRMLAETWYTDRAAVEAGLADQVEGDASPSDDGGPSDEGTQDRFDLSMFKHPPEELLARMQRDADAAGEGQLTKRDIERALRDAGMSRNQAKAFIAAAGGYLEHERTARDAAELVALRDALRKLNA